MAKPTNTTLLIMYSFLDRVAAEMAADAFRNDGFSVKVTQIPNERWGCQCERTQAWCWLSRWLAKRRAAGIAARFGAVGQPVVLMVASISGRRPASND
jgi:hypothetical protein